MCEKYIRLYLIKVQLGGRETDTRQRYQIVLLRKLDLIGVLIYVSKILFRSSTSLSIYCFTKLLQV
jgi:hypothetical protein